MQEGELQLQLPKNKGPAAPGCNPLAALMSQPQILSSVQGGGEPCNSRRPTWYRAGCLQVDCPW